MRPINEIVDDCIKMMKPHEIFSWESWWVDVIKNGEVPSVNTFKYAKFIEKRCKIKQQVDIEFIRRKLPYRLICPGAGQGIYLVNEKDVAEMTADSRIRKIVNCFKKGHKIMSQLSLCKGISSEDSKMLERLSALVELQQNTMIGTMAKMRSLPPATKKRLLKHLGVKT
jgi:hypothetical protein